MIYRPNTLIKALCWYAIYIGLILLLKPYIDMLYRPSALIKVDSYYYCAALTKKLLYLIMS